MKKIHALFLCVAWLLCMLTLSALAADYVYYENDFSDVTTLSDFTQYRGKWEIVDGQLTLTAAILGGFLLLAAAALRLVSGGMAGLELILSVFLACSGAALLYALIAQRRSGAFAPTALLVPVCFLVVQLIVTYRANARDSVLGHFYVELLLLAALCLASLYLAAFAYRCGAPRSFAPAAHLALTLAAACCVDMALARRFAGLAACLGAALLLLAYLEAAGDFEG